MRPLPPPLPSPPPPPCWSGEKWRVSQREINHNSAKKETSKESVNDKVTWENADLDINDVLIKTKPILISNQGHRKRQKHSLNCYCYLSNWDAILLRKPTTSRAALSTVISCSCRRHSLPVGNVAVMEHPWIINGSGRIEYSSLSLFLC